MGKHESTAVNDLINLVATQGASIQDADDLMFRAPPRKGSAARMSTAIPAATGSATGSIEPLPRGRAPHGTREHALPPVAPQVRLTTAPPSRALSIPSIPADTSTPPPVAARATLPPPSRPSAPRTTGAHVLPAIPMPPRATAPVAAPMSAVIATPALPSITGPRLHDPTSAESWSGTTQVPRAASLGQLARRFALPMSAMVVLGVCIGAYVALDRKSHARTPASTALAGAPASEVSPTVVMPTTESAPAAVEAAAAAVEAAPAAAPATLDEPAPITPPNVVATVPTAVTPPNLAAEPAAPAVPAIPAVAAAPTQPTASLVDVRIDSTPAGATVMLVDRGKTTFLGTTPISTAVDPSRSYDIVFAYRDRPTQLEHLDPRTTSRVAVTLATGRPKASKLASEVAVKSEVAKPEVAKPEIAKPERVKSETAKPETAKPAVAKVAAAKPATTSTAITTGVLMISSKPPCEIYVDGKATGMLTPQRAVSLTTGKHKITLVSPDKSLTKTLSVQITADKPTKVIQDLMTP